MNVTTNKTLDRSTAFEGTVQYTTKTAEYDRTERH